MDHEWKVDGSGRMGSHASCAKCGSSLAGVIVLDELEKDGCDPVARRSESLDRALVNFKRAVEWLVSAGTNEWVPNENRVDASEEVLRVLRLAYSDIRGS